MPELQYETVRESPNLPAHFQLVDSAMHVVIPAHWHEYLEILCMVSGELHAVVQAKEYTLHAGDVLLVNSGDIHMTETSGSSYYLLQISARRLREYFPEGEVRFETYLPATGTVSTPHNHAFRVMDAICREQADGYGLRFTARLFDFLYSLYANHRVAPAHTTGATKDMRRLLRTVDWLDSHYAEPIALEQAAANAGLSREHFCRMFKRYTGQTFVTYLNTLRTMHVYADMAISEEPISELLVRHGIGSYRVFRRTFFDLYGDTPQHIRKQQAVHGMP